MKTKEVTLSKQFKIGTFINCKMCGKSKRIKPCNIGINKYCSHKCYSLDKIGNIPWNKGLKGYMSGEKHWSYGKKRQDVARENNWKWNGGIKTYRKIAQENGLLKECNQCKSQEKLLIHHKDRNRYNNKTDNLETLCTKCHYIEHKGFNRWGQYAY